MSGTITQTGKITGVGAANEHGYANVKFEVGGETLWLSTKTPEMMSMARDLKGHEAIIDYIENSKTVNGRTFINRYIERISPVVNSNPTPGTMDSGTTTTDSEPAWTPSQDDFRRSKEEMRKTEAAKIAATLMISVPKEGTTQAEVAAQFKNLANQIEGFLTPKEGGFLSEFKGDDDIPF
jgi:hypothetical protein